MSIENKIYGLELQYQWQSLLQSLPQNYQGDRRIGILFFWELVNAYSSDNRFYHSLAHVKYMLDAIASWESQAHNYPAIQLAAWFHDAIYNPKAKDNEEKSAAYAAKVLKRLNISPSTIDAVTQMILKTKHHQGDPEDIDSQILLDADLAILGEDESSYRFYSQGIRREYAWLSFEEYRSGRIDVLKKLLQRPRIYFTDKMLEIHEVKARKNMLNEIELLSSSDSDL